MGIQREKYNIIHPDTKIGKGTTIMNYVEIRKGVIIGRDCYIDSKVCMTGDALIGNNVTIRNDVVIARGCEIGDNTFIAPKVMFNNLDSGRKKVGGAKIGKNCFIGTMTVLKEGITICDGVTIGSCSLVTKDITEAGIYRGQPARKV